MGILAITVTITCVLFLIIGVHTETRRVLYAMLAAMVIFIGSGAAIPSIVSILVPGGPALDANRQLMKDAHGEIVFPLSYVRRYQANCDQLTSLVYLSGSILVAGGLLLIFRAFRP